MYFYLFFKRVKPDSLQVKEGDSVEACVKEACDQIRIFQKLCGDYMDEGIRQNKQNSFVRAQARKN